MRTKNLYTILIVASLVISCVEPYMPKEIQSNPDFLVVDGFLDGSENEITVRLSKAVPLTSKEDAQPVVDAKVTLDSDGGTATDIPMVEAGTYRAVDLPLVEGHQYRIRIQQGNKRYVSEYVELKRTPAIEDVFLDVRDDQVGVMLNTGDPSGQHKYYRWSYEETWEYTTSYSSGYYMLNGEPQMRLPQDQKFRCWRTEGSSEIMIGSSEQLQGNVIRNMRIQRLPRGSQKIAIKYSIKVRQIALSEKGYTYWLNLEKTTENMGGLFDPMPGQVIGNITSETDPSQVVIGFFDAATVEERRIFVRPQDLPDDYVIYRPPYCALDTIESVDIPNLDDYTDLVAPVYKNGPAIFGYTTTDPICMDCRALGRGEYTKPEFWQ